MLEFKNVCLSINHNQILHNVNFKVMPGEVVAILGVSGAGKSSIFHLLTGERRPTSGLIKLDEFSLGHLSASSLQFYRRQIGVVFQDFRLLPQKTVYQNIAFALEVCGEDDMIKHKVPELLELVGLEKKAGQFPHELSGGEKQRTAIARALVHDPKILIADEATGNLDPRNSREIARLFKRLNENKNLTILFSTHDIVLVHEIKPRVIRLEWGSVQFDKYPCPEEEAFTGIL